MTVRPSEQITSSEYWEGAEPLPTTPLDKGIVDGFFSVHHLAAHGAAQIMALYRKAATKGSISEVVPIGKELPELERGDGLLRVVEDFVQPLSPVSFIFRPKNHDEDTFDELAAQMLVDKFYSGDSARMQIENEAARQVRVWRTVSYMTGSKSGHMLDGLLSSQLQYRPDQIGVLNQLPLVTVGQVYSRNKQRTKLLKVVAAEILIPGGGKKKRALARAKRQTTLKPAYNL